MIKEFIIKIREEEKLRLEREEKIRLGLLDPNGNSLSMKLLRSLTTKV